MVIEENRCTFRGSYSAIFSLTSILNGGKLTKEDFASPDRKLFPLTVDPVLKGLCLQGSKQEVTKVESSIHL